MSILLPDLFLICEKYYTLSNKKMYNINRVGENVMSVEEYDVTLSGETVTEKTLNGR